MKECKMCGKPIKIGFSKRKRFCSQECLELWYSKQRNKNTECVVCGNPLTGRQSKYCSDECKRVAFRRERHKYVYKYKKPEPETEVDEIKAEPKEETKPKNVPSIAEINKLAREAGLTYGQYVAKYRLYEVIR